jgi:hypothetical protein
VSLSNEVTAARNKMYGKSYSIIWRTHGQFKPEMHIQLGTNQASILVDLKPKHSKQQDS